MPIDPQIRPLKTPRALKHHIFVCQNERPAGHARGCCRTKESEALLQLFKKAVAEADLGVQVRTQKAGCLDVCEYGPAVTIYPDGVWYGGFGSHQESEERLEAVRLIVEEHLVKGDPESSKLAPYRVPGK